MKHLIYTLILFMVAAGPSGISAQGTREQTLESVLAGLQPIREIPIALDQYQRKLVYHNTFTSPEGIDRENEFTGRDTQGREFRLRRPYEDAVWIAEGNGDLVIRDGKLRVTSGKYTPEGKILYDTRSHMVVWNRKIFPENFLFEFTVNHCGSDNGLTLVFICTTGLQGESIFEETLPLRKAAYPKYHSDKLKNYTVSYWSRNAQPLFEAVSNRVRKNPGMNILGSGHSNTGLSSTEDYHIRILKFKGRIGVEVNGKVIVESNDPNPLGKGFIGFRSMEGIGEVTYDDIAVWELSENTP